MRLPVAQYQFLEDVYLRHFPIDIPDECLESYESIISHKDLLRRTKPSEKILHRLLDILIERISKNLRYQKLTMVKLIKQQLHPELMTDEVINRLFFIFQSLIVDATDEVAWKLTMTIKDIELGDEQIIWLVDHYEKSNHIINRLLRYPKANKTIYRWAQKCLDNAELENRLSELIGIQLNFNIKYKHKDKIAYVWGIHYSKLDERSKKDLLLKAITVKTIDEVIKICERNLYMDIVEFLYSECE